MDFPDDAGLIGEVGFEFAKVGLGLFAGLGFETALESGRGIGPDLAEMIRQRRIAAFVAELLDLAEQLASGQVRAGPDLVREIALVRLPRRLGRSREVFRPVVPPVSKLVLAHQGVENPIQKFVPPPVLDWENAEA